MRSGAFIVSTDSILNIFRERCCGWCVVSPGLTLTTGQSMPSTPHCEVSGENGADFQPIQVGRAESTPALLQAVSLDGLAVRRLA